MFSVQRVPAGWHSCSHSFGHHAIIGKVALVKLAPNLARTSDATSPRWNPPAVKSSVHWRLALTYEPYVPDAPYCREVTVPVPVLLVTVPS